MTYHSFKPATYGVMHFIVAVTVAFALTGDLAIALGIGLIEPTIQTIFYAVHEKVWTKVPRRPISLLGRTSLRNLRPNFAKSGRSLALQ